MRPQKWTSILTAFLILFASCAGLSQESYGVDGGTLGGAGQSSVINRTVKRNVAAILFSSLGGAILGLSTLSFYGEPQEHTENISIGALLGFLAGSSYVIYDSSRPVRPTGDFSSFIEESQRQQSRRALANNSKAPLLIHFSAEF